MKFLGQGFHKLEQKQDRQTHTQTDATECITTATFACGKNEESTSVDKGNERTCIPVTSAVSLNHDQGLYVCLCLSYWKVLSRTVQLTRSL